MARKIRAASAEPITSDSLDLADSRQKRGITLEQIAEGTKISIRFLRAIENEEFEKLPGGIFNTSYLRQYAEFAGFEVAALLARYEFCVNPAPPPEAALPESRGFFDRWFRMPAHAPRP